MYGAVYSAVLNGTDSFAGANEPGSVLLAALAVIAILVIQVFIVQFLWNKVLVRVTTVAKPIPSLIYTLGLLVLVAMLFPGQLAA